MPVKRIKPPIEVVNLLDNFDITTLQDLAKVAQNAPAMNALRLLLSIIETGSTRTIISSAGSVTTMDEMVDHATKSSFHRGRISAAVLANSALKLAPAYLDKRTEAEHAK